MSVTIRSIRDNDTKALIRPYLAAGAWLERGGCHWKLCFPDGQVLPLPGRPGPRNLKNLAAQLKRMTTPKD